MKNKKRWIRFIILMLIVVSLRVCSILLDTFIHIQGVDIAIVQSILNKLSVVLFISAIIADIILHLKIDKK